ncbi:cyclic dehypoxanthinyl futalosine synthase [Vulcanisaeta distributa]|uniref:Cyclic dehypoxanthine futalosine synthase n=1 Tax=Vulcanisaeta distributa (strain DSM 14429 / JCM 11212 / NBRC 100878 / IC-017) TaxID=572478 RepID=E1QT92_VULDI|nr:cyclic dehypoxanthinyl futalosine synthase [Vulcanisaeta distributa]ADN49684.1 Radical SAM domain protein [Vulcanisaeta distributa DSM 14429]
MRNDVANNWSPVVEKAVYEERLDPHDIEELFRADLWELGSAAEYLTRKYFGNVVTFIPNMILNYTNVCVIACRFCAFYRLPGHPEAYTLSVEEAVRRVAAIDREFGIRQVLVQGGINPELDIEYYEGLFKALKAKLPHVAIHGLSPIEVDYLARKHRMSYAEVLDRLRGAGMDTLAGGGGEILVDRVRRAIAPHKIDADTWLNIMETAHRMGIMSNATMMYGHVETMSDWAEHLYRIIELQRRTHGFLSFTAWNFEPGNSELTREVPYPLTSATLLRVVAVARLVFKNELPNIQSSWLTNGLEVAQLALKFGANDFGGTLYEERVIPATGLKMPILTRDTLINLIKGLGLTPAERDNWYRVIKVYN